MSSAIIKAAIVLLLTASAWAQTPTRVRSVTSLPATCNPGNGVTPADHIDLWTGAVNQAYFCSTTNTWTAIGIAGGGSVTGSGTTQFLPEWTSSSALGNSPFKDVVAPQHRLIDDGTYILQFEFGQFGNNVGGTNPNTSGVFTKQASSSCGSADCFSTVSNFDYNGSTTPFDRVAGVGGFAQTTGSTAASLLELDGGYFESQNNAVTTVAVESGVSGFAGTAGNTSTGTVTLQAGGYFLASRADKNVTTQAGVYGRAFNQICAGCTVTTSAAVLAASPSNITGTVSHTYGLLVQDQTVGASTVDPHAITTQGTAPSEFGGNLTVSGKTFLTVPYAALTDSATVTWAIGSETYVNRTLTFTVHGGSRTLNITGPANGGQYVLKIVQDATGGEGLTLGTGCTWKVSGGGGGTIAPTAAANAIDVLAFTYDGTNCLANFTKNFN